MSVLRHRRRRSGMTLIECLIGLLIVGTCIATMVSLWSFSYGMTNQNDAKGAAYNIGRRTIEKFKQTGFSGFKTLLGSNQQTAACLYYPAGSSYVSTIYYDSTGGGETTAQGTSVFKVTGLVRADSMTSDTPAAVADDALIAVDITVTQLAGLRPVTYHTGTYLVRSGI